MPTDSQITFRWHNVFLGIVMIYDETSPDGRVHCRLSWWSGNTADKWQWVDHVSNCISSCGTTRCNAVLGSCGAFFFRVPPPSHVKTESRKQPPL